MITKKDIEVQLMAMQELFAPVLTGNGSDSVKRNAVKDLVDTQVLCAIFFATCEQNVRLARLEEAVSFLAAGQTEGEEVH
jgi:hypothetical protein